MAHRFLLIPGALALLAGCAGADGPEDANTADDTVGVDDPAGPSGDSAAGTRPAGDAELMTVEGRLSLGTECKIVTTPDGRVYSLSLSVADFSPGDYVRIEGELADASLCMEGDGHLMPSSIEPAEPPARDRDPARAGGVRLTPAYVTGSWTARGVDADCDRPDFQISESPGAIVVETRLNGVPTTGRVVLGDYPRFDWDEPLSDMPIESRGPAGIAVLRPATDETRTMTLAGKPIEGDGVVFIKCAD